MSHPQRSPVPPQPSPALPAPGAVPARAAPAQLAWSARQTPAASPRAPVSPQVPAFPRVSVVIPTLNEALNLPLVLNTLPAEVFEVILVDGWSRDDTVAVARSLRPDIRVLVQSRRGKGNALACGFAAARGDVIVMLDADGSSDPGEITAFVDALLAGAHFAKGSRFADGGGSADITRLRRHGNRLLNGLVNLLYRTRYTDLCYGYNAFWRACLPYLGIDEPVVELPPDAPAPPPIRPLTEVRWGDGFEIETLVTVRVHAAGLRVAEVPSFEHPRAHGASNLNAVRDGLRVLRTIAVERRRLRTLHRPDGPLSRPWEPARPQAGGAGRATAPPRTGRDTGHGGLHLVPPEPVPPEPVPYQDGEQTARGAVLP